MYTRRYQWRAATAPSVTAESGWENTFTLLDTADSVKFTLTGYGWKTTSGTTDMYEVQAGDYKVYHSTDGITYTQFANVTCQRDKSSSSTVYKDAVVDTGKVAADIYYIKIIAKQGPLYTSWATGVIESIVSGGQFWSNLQVRA